MPPRKLTPEEAERAIVQPPVKIPPMKRGSVRNLNDILNALRAGKRITADEGRYVSAVIAFSEPLSVAPRLSPGAALGKASGQRRREAAQSDWRDLVTRHAFRMWRADPKLTSNRLAGILADEGVLRGAGKRVAPDTVRKFLAALRRTLPA